MYSDVQKKYCSAQGQSAFSQPGPSFLLNPVWRPHRLNSPLSRTPPSLSFVKSVSLNEKCTQQGRKEGKEKDMCNVELGFPIAVSCTDC